MGEGSSTISTVLKIVFLVTFFILFTYVIVITIITPILWQKYNQAIVDATLNSGVITVDWTIVHPNSNGTVPVVTMESNVTFTATGPMAATLKSATFDCYWLGVKLGHMTTPENYFAGDQKPLTVHQFTNMTITNITAYKAQAYIVANGGSIYWTFSGNVELSLKQYGITFDFTVFMSKNIQIVGRAPIGMRSFNIQPLSGTNTTLTSISDQSFFNPSNIGAQGLGDITMEVYDSDNVYIGNAIIPNLDLKIGENLQTGITSTAILTQESEPAISKMFSNWAAGIDQPFRAVGPIYATSGFYPLYHTSNQHFTVVGNKVPLIQNANVGGGGEGTKKDKKLEILPQLTLVNPTNMEVSNSDSVFTAFIPPLSNGFYPSFTATLPSRQDCPSTLEGISLGYAGPYGNASKTDSFSLPANGNLTTYFQPYAVQVCQDLIPIAICCGLHKNAFTGIPNGTASFMANVKGRTTVSIQDFSFVAQYEQKNIEIACTMPATAYTSPLGVCSLVGNICQVPLPGLSCPGAVVTPPPTSSVAPPPTSSVAPPAA